MIGGPLIVPSSSQIEEWFTTRTRQRDEFRIRAQRWIEQWPQRSLLWPQDQAAIVALGVPCDDCLQPVDQLHDGRHRIRRMVLGRSHWADGIWAHCGGQPPWPAQQ